MRKIFLTAIAFFAIFTSALTFVDAKYTNSVDVPVPTNSQGFVNIKRAEIMERVEAAKASRSAVLTERKKANIEKYWERLKNRLVALIEREQKLLDRMSSRVGKIESEEGLNLSDVKDGISDAQNSLNMALADLQAADDSIDAVLESENPWEAFKAVRDTVYEIRRVIINVHTNLAQMIGEIRGLRQKSGGEVEVSVTVTPTVTVVLTPTVTIEPSATVTP